MTAPTEGRVLTVKGPWWYAIMKGWKPVENRVWTAKPGPLWIHAGKGYDPTVWRWPDPFCGAGRIQPVPTKEELEQHGTGKIVCLVDVTGVTTGHPSPWAEPGVFNWQIRLVHVLASPVPARGQQRLWSPPPGLPDSSELGI